MTDRSAPLASSPGARDVIAVVTDSFEEFGERITSDDPLGWPGYREQLRRASALSDESEAVVTGAATVAGLPAVVVAMDFRFMGGSMGAATGTRIVGAIDEARRRRWPLVSLIASGGARVQEGMCSLVQMPRIARACALARRDGIPHIAVLRHPTTGGVWAALGSAADVIFAIDDATVAFTGPRVRGEPENEALEPTATGQQRQGARLGGDPGSEAREPAAAGEPRQGTRLGGRRRRQALEFTASGQYRHGAVDRVIPADEVRDHVALAVELLGPGTRGEARRADHPPILDPAGAPPRPGSAWDQVLAARRPTRPRAGRYLEAYFETRLEISGDRAGGRDRGMLCGFGRRGGRTIAYAAQTGSPNTGAGFRTATRLLELAATLRLPVLTLIDTPGAANDATAERHSVGTAIGQLLHAIAEHPGPITSLVIGEGGSGGALALCSPDDLWIVADGYFAVIAPESAAAILKLDPAKAPGVAGAMRLAPRDLLRLGVVQGVVGEAAGNRR